MTKHTVLATNRRPIKFTGDLIATNSEQTDEELFNSIDYYNSLFIRLKLFKTESGKAIVLADKFTLVGGPGSDAMDPIKVSTCEIFGSVEDYIKSVNSEEKIGRFTYELMLDLVEKNPEYEDIWAEVID